MSKRGGLHKNLRIITTARSLRDVITSYIDELSKEDIESGMSSVEYGKIVNLPERSRYRVYGFVKEALSGNVSEGGRLEQISDWWQKRAAKLERKAYHHTFSLNPDLARDLAACGIPVADVLFDSVSRTYSDFTDQFFASDEIGFIAGLHREKAHPHVHVLVYPMTLKGRRLNFSRLANAKMEDRLEGRDLRIDFQGFLREKFERQIQHYQHLVEERKAEKNKQLLLENVLRAAVIGTDGLAQAKATVTKDSLVPTESLISSTHQAGVKFDESTDKANRIIEIKTKRIKTVLEGRKVFERQDIRKRILDPLTSRVEALRADFVKNASSYTPEQLDGIQIQSMRVAADLLEVVAMARPDRLPVHLARDVDTKAINKGSISPVTSAQVRGVLIEEQQRYGELHNPRTLSVIANRDLSPVYTPDAIEATVISGTAPIVTPDLESIFSADKRMTDDQMTVEITRRAESLAGVIPAILEPQHT